MLKTNLIEHPIHLGFFQHPTDKSLYLSKEGQVYNSKNNSFSKIKIYTDGYRKLSSGKSIHRLLCEVFLEVPKDVPDAQLVVNHLNGNKSDNRLENLEWTTYQGNAIHAYQSGLRSDNTPVLVKDIQTDEIQRFYSIWECARHFKMNAANLYRYLDKGIAAFKRYVLIREGQDWPVDVRISTRQHNLDTVLYDSEKDQYIIFATVTEAACHAGLNEGAVYTGINRVKKQGKMWYEKGHYRFCFLSDYIGELPKDTPWMKRKFETKARFPVKTIPVSVENLETGEVKEYPSTQILADELGVTKNTLQKRLWECQGVWKKKLKVTYLHESPISQ